MKKLIFVSMLLSGFMFASAQVDTAVIRGKIQSGNVKTVSVEWLRDNPINGILKSYSAPVNDKGEFLLKIPLTQISPGRISDGKRNLDICLLPTDNLFVDADGDQIKFSGKGAEKNNFLYMLASSGYRDRDFYTETNTGKLSPKDFAIKMAEFRDKRVALLQEFVKTHSVEPIFQDFFLIENSVIYVDLIMNYPDRYAYYNKIKKDSLELTPEYYKYRQLKNIVDDKNVLSNTYLHGLRNFLFVKANDVRKSNPLAGKSFNPFHVILIDSLKGRTQEYVMARWLVSEFSRDAVDTVIHVKFKEIARDPLAMNTVAMAFEKYNQKRALIGQPLNNEFMQTLVEDTLGNKFTLSKIIEHNKGKVIYLDIWGLGCGPCRVTMPASKKLKDKLTGKPIEFVFLSVEGMSKKRWEEAFKVCLTRTNQYCLTEGFYSKFLKFMEINWVPCYMIIDKEGKLVDYTAPRPGEFGLEEKLIRLAEN